MPRSNRPSSFTLALIVSLFIIAGCGGQPSAAENPGPQAKATEPAAPAKTSAAAADRGATTDAKASAPAHCSEPADARQLAQVLDLTSLAIPTGGTLGDSSPARLNVGVLLPVRAAVDFYVAKLDALGWKRTDPANAESITDSFAQVQFGKDGYLLSLTAMTSQPKESGVTIEHVGNFDARTLPRVAGAEDQYSSQTSSLYFTAAKVADAIAELRRLLKADGWQEYDRAFSQKAVRPDADDLLFRKKACSLGVSVSRPPAQPNKTAVQYFVSALARDMPAPADASHVEIEDSRWIMKCAVPRDLPATAAYYRAAMRDIGFTKPPYESKSDKAMSLSFESPRHDLVLVSLAADAHAGRGTQVELEGHTAAFLEAMKKAQADAERKRHADEKAAAEDKARRVKAFQEESQRQDDIINRAVGKAIKDAAQAGGQGEAAKKAQADANAALEKALQGAGLGDGAKPGDKPAK